MSESPPHVRDADPVTTAVIAAVVPVADLPAFFDRAFSTLPAVLESQGVHPTGAAFAFHRRPVTDTADLEVGFPVDAVITPERGVTPSALAGGRVASVVHCGGFDGLPDAWAGLAAWIEDRGLVPADGMWEVYLTEPTPEMAPSELRTELCWPVASATDG
jgi:effector-binding domain-containing protein